MSYPLIINQSSPVLILRMSAAAGNTMDPYQQILENTLFQFDWGQDNPINHCTNLQTAQIGVQDLLKADPFSDAIAKYHNWYNTFTAADASQIIRPDVIAYRQERLSIILSRLLNEKPEHPVLRIYATECRLYNEKQDRIFVSTSFPL